MLIHGKVGFHETLQAQDIFQKSINIPRPAGTRIKYEVDSSLSSKYKKITMLIPVEIKRDLTEIPHTLSQFFQK